MKPLISIVMAVYNNINYFPLAVESILSQDFDSFELIIVDDGSTDRTPEIADAFAEKDSRVSVIHQHNQWIYNSYNNGVAKVIGEYILIVNSDDLLAEHALRILGELVRQNPYDAVFFPVQYRECFGDMAVYSLSSHFEQLTENIIAEGEENIRALWPNLLKTSMFFDQINLYKAQLVKDNPFRSDIYMADNFFNLDIACRLNHIICIKDELYYHYIYHNEEKGNASKGKYFAYEHDMFNLFYYRYRELFSSWGVLNRSSEDVLSAMRIRRYSTEIRNLMVKNSPVSSLDDAIAIAFHQYTDQVMEACAKRVGRREELERRLIWGCLEILSRYKSTLLKKMGFVHEILSLILNPAKRDEDIERLGQLVNLPDNTCHLPFNIYQSLLEDYEGTERRIEKYLRTPARDKLNWKI